MRRLAIRSFGKELEKPGHSYIAGGDIKYYNHFGNSLVVT